ncbi:MAG: xylulokinase [Candidatus Atribacteria bacterium]|nr:xylulokinase [Candidatus Atribacteria bacterium]
MANQRYIIAYDLGTTGNKATIFDDEGNLVSSAFGDYQTYYPKTSWVEQEPKDWWKAVGLSNKELLEKSGVKLSEIACLTFSGQMMGCVPVDKNGESLGRALIWADQRGVNQAERLTSKLGKEYIYQTVGHRPSASYSAAKIMWIKDNEPARFKRIYKVLQAKDFIAARMTGNFYTDYSDASGTNLFDLNNLTWSDEIIEAAGLSKDILPEAVPSTKIVGKLKKSAALELGLTEGIPIVIGGGDGCCAAAGAGVIAPGTTYHYLGSSSWIGIATGKPIIDPLMRTFNWVHVVPGLYSPTGTMQAAGASYQWARDVLCPTEIKEAEEKRVSPYQIMDGKSAKIPAGSNNLLYLPYLMGERSPYWNPSAKGAFIGLTIKHTREHMIRSVMEGVALNMRIIMNSFIEQGAEIDKIRLIGGGAKGNVWRGILADVFNKTIVIPNLLDEATSMGAALIGGVGVGIYDGFGFVNKMFKIKEIVNPDENNSKIYNRIYSAFKDAYKGLKEVYEILNN